MRGVARQRRPGNAAVEMLRREGYTARLRMFSSDASVPCDRPNLSKGFLAGSAPEESNPLQSQEFYQEHGIDLKVGARAASIDTAIRQVQLVDGNRYAYDALPLATEAEPIRLKVPGEDLPHVHYLRSVADSRSLVASALVSTRAVVIGSSSIGLEVAASLRAWNIDMHVIGREICPMEKLLGLDVGNFIPALHESHGVTFHLGTTVTSIEKQHVTLQSGERLQADLVVMGIDVRPVIALAEQTGLAIERGITVDKYLETSVSSIFAGDDIACWPDRLTASASASNIGWWLSAKGRRRTVTCLISGSGLAPCRFSGLSSTISVSRM